MKFVEKIRPSLKKFFDFFKIFVLIWIWQTITFSLLLLVYINYNFLLHIANNRFFPKKLKDFIIPKVTALYKKIVLSSTTQERTINRINLIDLAIKNMLFKKSRAMITVGGMAIGIGAIVFLVSIGFGLQEMVISRVARLDELKQADVSTQPGSKETLNDKTIASIADFSGVTQVLPQIAIVSRIEYQNSVSDVAVYGVTSEYLKNSAIQPTQGKLFDSNEVSAKYTPGKVAGVTQDIAKEYDDSDYELNPSVELPIEFTFEEKNWIKIRIQPSGTSELVGYTKRPTGTQIGYRVWGNPYPEAKNMELTVNEKTYSPWIKSEFSIWFKQNCDSSSHGCIDGTYVEAVGEDGKQVTVTGYTALTNVILITTLAPSDPVSQVLGVTTDELLIAQANTDTNDVEIDTTSEENTNAETDSSGWVEIASESAVAATQQVTKVSLGSGAKKQAIATKALLQVLGISETEAIGKTFKSTFVVVGELLDKPGEKVESSPEEYTIVGVVPEDKTPYYFVPFIDLRLMGINQYSQLKVVTDSPQQLPQVRKQIESLGYSTRSVADTVKQIDQLFATARVLLAILGFVALSIAALGMFNTLTVSLLERTREVGLMKAMGMRSNEVRELFLTESLVMGFFWRHIRNYTRNYWR